MLLTHSNVTGGWLRPFHPLLAYIKYKYKLRKCCIYIYIMHIFIPMCNTFGDVLIVILILVWNLKFCCCWLHLDFKLQFRKINS